MGNAASCQACGSDKTLKTAGSENDLNHHNDYYRAADSGPEADDPLVRGGERNISSSIFITLRKC